MGGGTCPYLESTTQAYQGSHTGGTLLKTVNTSYQPVTSGPNGGFQPYQTTSLWAANSQENESTFSYDNAITFHTPYWASATQFSTHYGTTYSGSYGLLETKKDYDYGSGAPGALLRTTATSYEALINSNYLANNLLALPASVAVTGSGPGSTTTYSYDQPNTLMSSGITTQHDSNPPAGTYRGNPTTISRYLNTNGTYLNTTSTNFDTGMVDVVKDPKTNPTTYGYSPTYAGALLTSITNALNQTTTFAYDFNTGYLTSMTDPNNQQTTYTYNDTLGRLTAINYPDSGQTSYTYNDATPAPTVTTTKTASPDPSITRVETFDGLGRSYKKQITSVSPAIISYTTYDGLGRPYYVYNATGCNPPTTNCGESTWGYSTYSYDALSRTLKVTELEGSAISTSYGGNCTTVTDEAGKTRETCTDGLGRVSKVIENPGGLNYQTNYTYDALDDLTNVVENSSRQRIFVYDSLSRLTSATNPESGTTTYSYDADGNVATKTDARSIKATYSYDNLSRVLSTTYSDGTTPNLVFSYDVAPSWMSDLKNVVGRLVEASNQYAGLSGTASASAITYSYDAMGRIVRQWQQTPSASPGGYFVYQSYDLAGNLTSNIDHNWVSISYVRDGAGRVSTVNSSLVDAQHPANLVSGIKYAPNGAMTQLTYGNGLTESTVYNSLFQPCRNNVNSSATIFTSLSACGSTSMPTGNVLDLQYYWSAGSDNGNLVGAVVAGAQTYSRTYNYDQLNRLSSMTGTGGLCTGLNWSYDPWGNRTSQTQVSGTCFQQPTTTITANNQFSGYGYDAAGNMTSQPGATYTYNAESRLTSSSGGAASYIYDASGRRITKTVSGAFRDYIYDMQGDVVSELTSVNGWATGYVYLNGRRIAEYANATTYFITGDHLGSSRLLTNLSKGVQDCNGLYPYGEQDPGICTSTNTTPHKFTGYERDAESGLDNAQARYYGSPLGRFMSPDPAGMFAVRLAYPQTLNRYSYVLNNPLSLDDPLGFDCAYLNDQETAIEQGGVDQSSNYWECSQNGGYWVDGAITGIQTNGSNVRLWGTTNGSNQTYSSYYDTTLNVGFYVNNPNTNPFGHIALGIAGMTPVGLNPASDTGYISKLLYNLAASCITNESCLGAPGDALSQTTVPGAVLPQSPGQLVQNVAIPITGPQASLIQQAINQSAQNPPPYSVFGPQPACDCGTWVQGVMAHAGLSSGSPAPIPVNLMSQLSSIYGGR